VFSDGTIRAARESDLDALVEYWLDLGRLHVDRTQGFVQLAPDAGAAFRSFIAEQLASPQALVIVAAEPSGAPVGFANAKRQATPDMLPGEVGYLDHIYVRPEARRAGIATALVRRCLEWGAERSLTRWAANVYCWNEPSLALLGRFGLLPRSYRVMGDPPWSAAVAP
jgi:GNAT superfamily N-acetyltransferase